MKQQFLKLNIKELIRRKNIWNFDHKVDLTSTKGFQIGTRKKKVFFKQESFLLTLQKALSLITKISSNRGYITFISKSDKYKEFFIDNRNLFYYSRWLGGTLTNWVELKFLLKRGQCFKYLKGSERIKNFREMSNYGIPPNALVSLIDNEIPIRESSKLRIPTISILDGLSNSDLVTYPLLSQASSKKNVELNKFFTYLFYKAVIEGELLEKQIFKDIE